MPFGGYTEGMRALLLFLVCAAPAWAKPEPEAVPFEPPACHLTGGRLDVIDRLRDVDCSVHWLVGARDFVTRGITGANRAEQERHRKMALLRLEETSSWLESYRSGAPSGEEGPAGVELGAGEVQVSTTIPLPSRKEVRSEARSTGLVFVGLYPRPEPHPDTVAQGARECVLASGPGEVERDLGELECAVEWLAWAQKYFQQKRPSWEAVSGKRVERYRAGARLRASRVKEWLEQVRLDERRTPQEQESARYPEDPGS